MLPALLILLLLAVLLLLFTVVASAIYASLAKKMYRIFKSCMACYGKFFFAARIEFSTNITGAARE